MKTRIVLLWMLVLLTLTISAETSKKTAKAKSKTVKAAKPKPETTPKQQAGIGIPADAFLFKDNNNQAAIINTLYKAIVVEGEGNKISIGEGNAQIYIKGKNNDITMKSADYIEITGNDNFVSWENSKNPTGKPVILDKGGYNNIGKKTGNALKKSDN